MKGAYFAVVGEYLLLKLLPLPAPTLDMDSVVVGLYPLALVV